ncbi:hypothetical protein PAL_GLEAN10006365 [Pteropus alecto]|uniref:Uncharacterized protein n=1 Tax=Pteropus alecto TaxID=9402 RepID=L5K8Z0_PTEAL|nr:hypothetical protein PAL_GLEAN10006365 [Pteropus alecto]
MAASVPRQAETAGPGTALCWRTWGTARGPGSGEQKGILVCDGEAGTATVPPVTQGGFSTQTQRERQQPAMTGPRATLALWPGLQPNVRAQQPVEAEDRAVRTGGRTTHTAVSLRHHASDSAPPTALAKLRASLQGGVPAALPQLQHPSAFSQERKTLGGHRRPAGPVLAKLLATAAVGLASTSPLSSRGSRSTALSSLQTEGTTSPPRTW